MALTHFKVLLVLLLLSISHYNFAAPSFTLPAEADHLTLKPYTWFYVDRTDAKSVQEIIAMEDDFKPLAELVYDASTYVIWKRIAINNVNEYDIDWKILTSVSYFHNFQVYLQVDNKLKTILSLDSNNHFLDWPVSFGKFTIPLQLPPSKELILYIQYKVPGNIPLKMELFSAKYWEQHLVKNTLFNGIILGVLTLSLFIILAQLLLKPSATLYYLLGFIVSGIFFVVDISGYFTAFIWPLSSPTYPNMIVLTMMLPLVPYFLFIASSLALKKNAPRLYQLYFLIISSALLIMVFSFFINTAGAILLLSPIAALVLLITIYVALSKDLPLAKYYATSLFFHVLFINLLVMIFVLHGEKMPFHLHHEVIIQIGFTVEALMFTALFTYQKHLTDKEYHATLRINQQHKHDEQLANQRTVIMEELVEKKNNLLADVSHELRTPLTALKLQVESLQYNLEEDITLSYKAIDNKLNEMSALINDIYQLAQSDIGALKLTVSPVVFPVFLLQYQQEFTAFAKEHGHTCIFINELTSHIQVDIDKHRVKQVINNLINNSCSYTDAPGEIQLKLSNDESNLIIKMIDSSPNVTTRQLDLIFDRLYRVESSRSRATGGSGLGLSISKSLIEAHHGSITAGHSSLGGLIVTIRLPIKGIQT